MAAYAYLRVSTTGQTTDNQRKEIIDAGFAITEWFSDTGVSGSTRHADRPAFKAMLDIVAEGDVCIFSRMDRLGRTAVDSLNTLAEFKKLGVKVIVLQFGGLDMLSTAGKMLTTMLAAVAEMERDLCIERIHAGLARTKASGTKLGAPLTITPKTLEAICKEKGEGLSLDKLASKYSLPRATIARNIQKWGGKLADYAKEFSARSKQYEMSRA